MDTINHYTLAPHHSKKVEGKVRHTPLRECRWVLISLSKALSP